MESGWRRQAGAIALSILLALAALGTRLAVSGPADLVDLDRFRTATGVDFGPEAPYFASGLDGDGQAFAFMAAHPFGEQEKFGLYKADYRYSRVGYSWLAATLALGQEHLLLLGLSMVGLLSVGAVAYLSVQLRERIGPRAWWLLANPALLVAGMGDTAESLALLLLTLALLGRGVWSAVALALVRPSYLLALADHKRLIIPATLIAVGFRSAWVIHLDGSFLSGTGNLGLPFFGLLTEPSLVGLVVTTAGLVTLLIGLRHRSWAWILSGLLVVCLSGLPHADPINAVRAAGLLPVLWAFGVQRQVDSPTRLVERVTTRSYPEQSVRTAQTIRDPRPAGGLSLP